MKSVLASLSVAAQSAALVVIALIVGMLNSAQSINRFVLLEKIEQSRSLITGVLFMGGEWASEFLIPLLQCCREFELKTALYTGLDYCPSELLPYLDFVKTGRWIKELGGLEQPGTNQRLIDLRQSVCLNPLFWQAPELPFAMPLTNINKTFD